MFPQRKVTRPYLFLAIYLHLLKKVIFIKIPFSRDFKLEKPWHRSYQEQLFRRIYYNRLVVKIQERYRKANYTTGTTHILDDSIWHYFSAEKQIKSRNQQRRKRLATATYYKFMLSTLFPLKQV